MINRIILSIFISTLFITGCATKESLETYEPLKVTEFTPIEKYELDLSKLDEKNEDAIASLLDAPLYANVSDDGSLNIVFSEEEANSVIIYSEDYAKLADIVELSEGYRSVAISQSELIKVQQETIKSLQQLVLLQQESRDIYRQNFIMSNKLYLQEHKLRMREKLSNDIRFFATAVGTIAIAML
jgi:hypothetical protein